MTSFGCHTFCLLNGHIRTVQLLYVMSISLYTEKWGNTVQIVAQRITVCNSITKVELVAICLLDLNSCSCSTYPCLQVSRPVLTHSLKANSNTVSWKTGRRQLQLQRLWFTICSNPKPTVWKSRVQTTKLWAA